MRAVFLFRICCVVCCVLSAACALRGGPAPAAKLDPAAWGSDHVDKPVPEYATGDECLFCHRSDVGPSWLKNAHQRTIREVEPDSPAIAALKASAELKPLAEEVKLVLGGVHSTRFLKKATEYGRADLLTATYDTPVKGQAGKLRELEGKPHWDKATFADRCAGCHATAVNPATKAFTVVALDCYTCHGVVAEEHGKDTRLVYLSKKREDPARVVTSICASCHVRTGKSKKSGLPYANNFVAGDNLFRDFQVDFSPEALAALSPADRHVLENVRDVTVLGKEEVTCLTCHDVHKQSSKKHTRVAEDDSCLTCHNATGSKKKLKPYEDHSRTCQY
jgi:predicted CXXCH cytochrome family protein